MNYISPGVENERFTCPYCNTLAQQKWERINLRKYGIDDHIFSKDNTSNDVSKISVSTCQSCYRHHTWINGVMVQPDLTGIPLPNQDMPGDVMDLYNEAREVFSKSPRSAAALLQLALQLLCIHLGGEGKNINDDIGNFVKDGLDMRVQKSLDIVRVTGNNAVHPGQLNMVDNNDIAARLFGLLNFIVDAMITQPAQIDSFFSELPQGARDAIARRDA